MLPSRESIRPSTSLEEAKELLKRFYGLEASEIQELECYSDRTFYVKVESKRDQLEEHASQAPAGCTEFILKVLNSLDSLKDHVGKSSGIIVQFELLIEQLGHYVTETILLT